MTSFKLTAPVDCLPPSNFKSLGRKSQRKNAVACTQRRHDEASHIRHHSHADENDQKALADWVSLCPSFATCQWQSVRSSTHSDLNDIQMNREPEDESQAQKPADHRHTFLLSKVPPFLAGHRTTLEGACPGQSGKMALLGSSCWLLFKSGGDHPSLTPPLLDRRNQFLS